MHYARISILCLLSMSLFSGCVQNTSVRQTTQPTPVTFRSTAIATIVAYPQENTALQQAETVGTTVRIGADTLLTAAHVLHDTGLVYRINDASGTTCDIINTTVISGADLAIITVYGACSGTIVSPKTQFLNAAYSSSVMLRSRDHFIACPLTFSDTKKATTSCRFTPGMSGSPVLDLSGNLIGLVQGTDDQQGWIVRIPASTISLEQQR